MEEKGGNTEGENKNISANYVNPKMAIYAIVVVVLGIGILATMIFLGIGVANSQQPTNENPPISNNDNPVLESIKIEYDETQMRYWPSQEYTDKYRNSLMHRYGVDDQEYAIIRTNNELDDFISAVNYSEDGSAVENPFTYSVNDEFFKTGVIIAIAKEDAGLESMSVDEVYRDENYNLQIYANYSSPSDTMTKYGKFSLLQIQNIQPKSVEILWNSTTHGNEEPYGELEKKPIIYLYPTETTDVKVKLSNPERITTDYPDYNDGWEVTARPDGTLTTKAGKKLYALYYESQNIKKYTNKDLAEGFVVSRGKVEDFLDEKLAILGLNYKEREEFISYWIGELESKPFVFIRFQTADEIEKNMGLLISPKPETTIRVMMEYKKLDNNIKVKAQKLQPVERKGFTVVEWGGTEVKQ